MKRRACLEIHRDDHKYDTLGRIFLGVVDGEEILDLLRRYLGPQASLHRVELRDDVLAIDTWARQAVQEAAALPV